MPLPQFLAVWGFLIMEKSFKFKELPEDIHFVNAWECDIHDGLIFLSFGIQTDYENKVGERLISLVIEKGNCAGLLKQLNLFFEPPNQPQF